LVWRAGQIGAGAREGRYIATVTGKGPIATSDKLLHDTAIKTENYRDEKTRVSVGIACLAGAELVSRLMAHRR
jgi:hypothetical protein